MTDTLKKRIKKLNNEERAAGKSVLYVMSRDQRVKDNFALLAAYKHSKNNSLDLIVLFNLYSKVTNRLKNQYKWMMDGLQKVEKELISLNIDFILEIDEAAKNIEKLVKERDVEAIYFDFSPLNGPQKHKSEVSKNLDIPCYVVDTHNIVPVWETSDKEEYAARTIRPKIHKKLDEFLQEPEKLEKLKNKINHKEIDWDKVLEKVNADWLDGYEPIVKSGENEALKTLDDFIHNKLEDYGELRNDPSEKYLSNLSAYLHFGQIHSLRAVLEVKEYLNRSLPQIDSAETRKKIQESADAFIEEIVVRKELSDNFCYYNSNYDNIKGAKSWALQTLKDHKNDEREFIYSYKELEQANTHDDAWNASQIQMTKTGKMHGYMRMYWCKKILEWTPDAKTAVEYAIKLNDRYELDGYDPNGYVGILWSIAGIHDRGWTEREIFGKIRYMNFNGLKRKFDIDKYIATWLKK